MKTLDIYTVKGPVLRKEALADGAVRIVTRWVIKGEQTEIERITCGFPTLEAAERSPVSEGFICVGMARADFADGSQLFHRYLNVWD